MIRLTHLDAVKYVRDPVDKLRGGVLHLPKHPAGVSHQGPRQPGGQLPSLPGHRLVQRLVLDPDIGHGRHQLVQGVIRAAEAEPGQGGEEYQAQTSHDKFTTGQSVQE